MISRSATLLSTPLLLLAGCGGSGGSATVPPAPTIASVAAYLAQSVAPDGNSATPLAASVPWAYERFDYASPAQAEQSFARVDGKFETIWSYPPYGAFSAASGDGGEVYQIEGDTVYAVATQDGGRPDVQQFGTAWPLFDIRVPNCSDGWETLGAPPLVTRACRGPVTYPAAGVPGGAIAADTIIAVHGSGQTESIYFGAGWGRLRWEARDAAGCAPSLTVAATPAASYEDEQVGALCDVRMPTRISVPPPVGGMTGDAFGWQP